MDLKTILIQIENPKLLSLGHFGLEGESQRITNQGALAATLHPKSFGSRTFHPYIQTDFSETQLELITPVQESLAEALRYLTAIHSVTRQNLATSELLWPCSMPPHLPDTEADIQIAQLATAADVDYRQQLAKKYGRRKQMMSGIHFNFGLDESLLSALFQQQKEYQDVTDFNNAVYCKLARNYLRHRWLISYLFGASPVAPNNFFTTETSSLPVRTIRGSSLGYRNFAEVNVSYTDFASYQKSLKQLVTAGHLAEAKEYYGAVRLRTRHKQPDAISYLEFRNLDLDPFAPAGVSLATLQFMHLFYLLMLYLPDCTSQEALALGDSQNETVALEHPATRTALMAAGEELFQSLQAMLTVLNLAAFAPLVDKFYQRLLKPQKTPAAKLLRLIEKHGYQGAGLQLAHEQQAHFDKNFYNLAGFEHLELSTQILLADAIKRGITVEVVDESDQLVKLTWQGQVEYVKNANMTSKDSYIVPLLMANKVVTKKILAEHGFLVPKSREYRQLAHALADYEFFAQRPFVIKPKSTNYGLGITIFPESSSYASFQQALTLAFKEDSHVLVEEYLPGTEYRFLVIDNQVAAVLLRIPAHVTGNGIDTIAQLVAQKNSNVLRGTHHRAPLEKIKLGKIERLVLAEAGMTLETVPQKGAKVWLRENSNISTGGDSLDVTDEMPVSYKKIAIAAVTALGAKVCGIDLIIPDLAADSLDYGILEANFNPAMFMHVFPESGTGRRVTENILDLLFPDSR